MAYPKSSLLDKAVEITKEYARSDNKPLALDVVLEKIYEMLKKLNSEE